MPSSFSILVSRKMLNVHRKCHSNYLRDKKKEIKIPCIDRKRNLPSFSKTIVRDGLLAAYKMWQDIYGKKIMIIKEIFINQETQIKNHQVKSKHKEINM